MPVATRMKSLLGEATPVAEDANPNLRRLQQALKGLEQTLAALDHIDDDGAALEALYDEVSALTEKCRAMYIAQKRG